MDKDGKTTQTIPTATANNSTDDESITTSTESETFETWTLVTDKNKKGKNNDATGETNMEAANERVESLKSSPHTSETEDDDEKETEKIPERSHTEQGKSDDAHNTTKSEDDSVEEFSDGISIISESETSGRLSPHPYLRDHLSNLNLKYSTGDEFDASLLTRAQITPPNSPAMSRANDHHTDDTTMHGDSKPLRQRRKRQSSSADARARPLAQNQALIQYRYHPVTRQIGRLLAGLFVCVFGLVAFAKWYDPDWETIARIRFSQSMITKNLEEQLSNMEIQNNMMRAEIDALTRQVDYLQGVDNGGNIMPPRRSRERREQRGGNGKRKSKTFKAWSGNGKNLDPVDITKHHLKEAYHCPAGEFSCGEDSVKHKPLFDDIGEVVNDALGGIFNGNKDKENEEAELGQSTGEKQKIIESRNTQEAHFDDFDEIFTEEQKLEDKNKEQQQRQHHHHKFHSDDDDDDDEDDDDDDDDDDDSQGVDDDDDDEDDDDGAHGDNYINYKTNNEGKMLKMLNHLKRSASRFFNNRRKGLNNFQDLHLDSRLFGENNRRQEQRDNSKKYKDNFNKRDESKENLRVPRPRGDNSKERRDNFKRRQDNSKERYDNSKEHLVNSKKRYDNSNEHHDHSRERHEHTAEHHGNSRKRYDNSKERHDNSKERHDNPKERHDNSNESEENSKEHHGNSKERHNNSKERHDNSKERHDNSKEHHDNSKEHHDNSKERHSKEYRENSKERNGNRKYSPDERRWKDGEWHEKLMQHRENARRQQEQHQRKNSNWFIERGGSREQMRYR